MKLFSCFFRVFRGSFKYAEIGAIPPLHNRAGIYKMVLSRVRRLVKSNFKTFITPL